jgi:hypothetical protein
VLNSIDKEFQQKHQILNDNEAVAKLAIATGHAMQMFHYLHYSNLKK